MTGRRQNARNADRSFQSTQGDAGNTAEELDALIYGAVDKADKQRAKLQAQVNGIVKTGEGSLTLFGAEITPAGLVVPDGIDRDTLEDIGEILISFERHIQVLIGDWLISYTALKYGEIAEIAAHFGYEAATLYNWQYTCKSVEISLRSEIVAEIPEGKSLGISHYELVQTLPRDEQKRWLIEARRDRLSVAELRKRIKGDVKSLPRDVFSSWSETGVSNLERDYKKMEQHEREAIARQIYEVIRDDLN